MIMHRDVLRGQSKGHVLVHDLFMLRTIGWLPEEAEYSELARQLQSEPKQPTNELDSAQLAFGTSKNDPSWAFPDSLSQVWLNFLRFRRSFGQKRGVQ